jgi:membrane-bound serine protease (ClpP class)
VLLPIVLTLVGMALVVAEVFFPSLGLLSVAAGTCILVADILAFQEATWIGWVFVAVQIVLLPVVIRGAFAVLPRTPFGRRMVLSAPTSAAAGAMPDLRRLLGREGVALTDLRPAGIVRVGPERVSVVAQGGLVTRDTPVIVVAVEGSEVRVRPLAEATPSAAAP